VGYWTVGTIECEWLQYFCSELSDSEDVMVECYYCVLGMNVYFWSRDGYGKDCKDKILVPK
jgi:hypothetical protein